MQRTGNAHGIMVKVVNYSLKINVFKLQLWYYFHFQTNTHGKGMNPLIIPTVG